MRERIGRRLLPAALLLLASSASSIPESRPESQFSSAQSAEPSASASSANHPPVPIYFTLKAAGYVTLVIDDAQGNRVRNLISDTLFPAGANTTWWDGSDDLTRVPGAAEHGVDLIPTHFVAPGRYTVRGLVHSAVNLHYELTAYGAGSPPWETKDGAGGWLTNHTPGSAALFVPADRAITGSKPLVYLGSYISEGGSSLAWVDLNGQKQGGRGWIGGNWTGAPYLARDTGSSLNPSSPGHSNPDNAIYVAAVWGDQKQISATGPMQLRITALTAHGDRSVLNYPFTGCESDSYRANPLNGQNLLRFSGYTSQIAGLSVQNGLIVVSLSMCNQVLLADRAAGRVIGLFQVEDPRGSAFDAEGNLLVLSGARLLRYRLPAAGNASQISLHSLGSPEILIASGLDDPAGITLGGNSIFISDRGASHQVKVFSMQGKLERAIGHPGSPAAGLYDPLHMNNPRGITIDSNQHLWVAEEDFQPKRVSEWTLDGKLLNAFYGPSEYGGGGSLDPTDKTRFYYHQMEFHLDWKTGQSTPAAVLYRPRPGELMPPPRAGNPSDVLYSNNHRYFTNSYTQQETFGATIGMLYLDEGGILHPVAALGRANDWPALQNPVLRSKLPPGADLTQTSTNRSVLFTWSDRNNNGQIDPDEVTFLNSTSGSITIEAGATEAGTTEAGTLEAGTDGPVMLDSCIDGKAMSFAPVRMLPNGIPVYELSHGTLLSNAAQPAASDGGGQVLASPQATVLTTAPRPFPRDSLGGIDPAGHAWSYPSLWPGLHPSHSAPVADHPGELIGTTRLLGGFIPAPAPGMGDLWAINGNLGPIYLFTADGLYITQLFQDVRTGKPWNMPAAQREMLLNDVTPHDENFFPSLTETKDGSIFLVDGSHMSLVRVDGLNTLKRIADIPLEITQSNLNAAQSYLLSSEAARQQALGPQTLHITLRPGPALTLRDLPNLLASASWATIDRRITQVGWKSYPDVTQAAITIAAGHLYAVFKTGDPNLLQNSGALPNAPFKTGGALDLMIGADPNADPNRKNPVAGDIRLIVYQVNGQTRAILYRPYVKGATDPLPFSSPSRTVPIDEVLDVSNQMQFDASKGVYSVSVPLSILGLHPHAGESIKADIGILRGNGSDTTQRVYWSNKATGITSDVPSEAALTPNLWGTWVFDSMP